MLSKELGFCTVRSDPCLYIERDEDALFCTALYVDYLLLAGSSSELAELMKTEFHSRLGLTDLVEAKFCTGLETLSIVSHEGCHLLRKYMLIPY